jgi:hypothetical protein
MFAERFLARRDLEARARPWPRRRQLACGAADLLVNPSESA